MRQPVQHKSDVSIHAPARGATSAGLRFPLADGVSIHAPARGATFVDWYHDNIGKFQSTPLHEGRHSYHSMVFLQYRFQSTPLHEGRRDRGRDPGARHVSIHAPARGATPSVVLPQDALTCFNPRPCTRGDTSRGGLRPCFWCFNPRPCTRGDAPGSRTQHSSMFQSTPLHEGRPPKKQSFEVVAYFKRNPRTVGKIRRFRLPSLL